MADKAKPVDASKLEKMRETLSESCKIENTLAMIIADPIDGDDVPALQDCKNINIPKDMTPEKAEAQNKTLRQNLKGMSDALRVSKA